MKKVSLFAIILAISGIVWAQTPPDLPPSPSVFGDFNAVKTISTESRYSVELFDSDVDNFIDVNWFKPGIGNFIFLGGVPASTAANANVTTTDTGFIGTAAAARSISLGYGSTLSDTAYLGLYYGGSLVEYAYGSKDDIANDLIEVESTIKWQNYLAVLFGTGGHGFRLDLIMLDRNATETIEKDVSAKTAQAGPNVALTWGTDMGNMAPWARIGFIFPATTVTTTKFPAGDDKAGQVDTTTTTTTGATLGIGGGLTYKLNDLSSFYGELLFGSIFGNSTKYSDDRDDVTSDGSWGIELNANYKRAFNFGNDVFGFVTAIIQPTLSLSFINKGNNSSLFDYKVPSANWFSLKPGFNLGIEYRYQKIALYTGFGLTLFTWNTHGFSGGDDDYKKNESDWILTGITWDTEKLGANSNLGFGITFTPVENLVIGSGLSFGNAPSVNLTSMNMTTSTGQMSGFSSVTLNMTVSYKFQSEPKTPREPKRQNVDSLLDEPFGETSDEGAF